MGFKRSHYEYLRIQAKQKFEPMKQTWIDCGKWAMPWRMKWLLSQTPGERNNNHVVDTTHISAFRSYVAGFLEGNTSASRPWYRIFSKDSEANQVPENKRWLQKFTDRTLRALGSSNFYHSAGLFYYDLGGLGTGAHFIDEIMGTLHFHNLIPGSYYVINDSQGVAVVFVHEFSLTVKALVQRYGRKTKNGSYDWSNFSNRVKNCYDNSDYTQMIDVATVIEENPEFDPEKPQTLLNKRWLRCTYELGSGNQFSQGISADYATSADTSDLSETKYLNMTASKRKPFIVGHGLANGNFEYGESFPTIEALGLIKSLNKKAISKDQAIEQMLRPALQGPANLRKSYITTASNSYVPLDPTSLSQNGLRTIFEVNPQIGALLQDQTDLRQQVEKLYYADYLLYLSRNPKTRTATETDAVIKEQQLVIGPNLQSLNWTYNIPVVEFVMSFVLDEDPFLEPPPDSLAGKFLQTEFISIFAQAQKAADLPAIDRYAAMVMNVGAIDPKILQKLNVDKLADLYEDRLFLPEGLNNPQAKVEAERQQALAQAERDKQIQQTIPAIAGAAKDMGLQAKPQ